ncbi:hypothetical protein [Thiomicrorhabdus sp.]|uniref:hypothetical protein n=1 Tax=Thiomicrorhabdus sp. TaxID=2039724 RepID=UPI0029C9359C|nr:hypothetical protein [Thiomicrorhabdus sp.]
MKAGFLILIISLLLSGCSYLGITEQKSVQVRSFSLPDNIDVITYPTQLRGAYVYTGGNVLKICAEPFPDVAASTSFKLTAEAINKLAEKISNQTSVDSQLPSVVGGGANVQNNLQQGIELKQGVNLGLGALSQMAELNGRTQFVLLARTFMYRTCEAAANGFIKPEDVPEQHKLIIDALTAMVDREIQKEKTKQKELDALILKIDPKAPMRTFYKKELDSCLEGLSNKADKDKCWDKYNRKMKILLNN